MRGKRAKEFRRYLRERNCPPDQMKAMMKYMKRRYRKWIKDGRPT